MVDGTFEKSHADYMTMIFRLHEQFQPRLKPKSKLKKRGNCEKSILICFRLTCDMRRASKSHYVNGLIATCDCWMISTFLRQHATVACRTNKPVYTARFCCTSHVASVLSHRVNVVCCVGRVEIQIDISKVGVLPIRIVIIVRNILFLSDEGPMLETVDYILHTLSIIITICS